MQQTAYHASDFDPALNPYVGKMASRLVQSFTSDFNSDRWTLITEILGFAAEAEQKLSEQNLRIAQLETLAASDELTGLANRRGFEDYMKRMLANAKRYRETGVLAYIDLDHFKKINDTLGHEAGDTVLCKVARLFTDNIRASDFAARLGGDEFAIVLTRCELENGIARMEKIQAQLEQNAISIDGISISAAASFGAIPYNGTSTIRGLLTEADQLMYRNKISRD